MKNLMPKSPKKNDKVHFVQFSGLFLNGNDGVSHFRFEFSHYHAVFELSLILMIET